MSVSQPTCPLCGGPIHDSGQVLLDVEGARVLVEGRDVVLTQQQMTIFLALWRNRPRLQSAERLLYLTAPEVGDDEREISAIQVQIAKMRPALRTLGISIDNVRGEGWRIIHKAA